MAEDKSTPIVPWRRIPRADREELIGWMRRCLGKAEGERAVAMSAALRTLERQHGKLKTPAPTPARRDAATYQVSDLRHRLELPESRPGAIAAIVKAVRQAGSIDAAAEPLGISKRTLYRALKSYKDLRDTVTAVVLAEGLGRAPRGMRRAA